jgi:opacity protein-like surface antigen
MASTAAGAGTVGIGANMGFSAINPAVGADTQIFAWPGSVVGFQPGVRLSYLVETRTHEGFLDTGLLRLSGAGESATYTQLSGNYQYNFRSTASVRPYLTAGVGMYRVSLGSDFGPGESGNSFLYGGGGGIRHWVSEEHGAVRAEARYDHVGEGSKIIQKADVFTFRLGFDLWLK